MSQKFMKSKNSKPQEFIAKNSFKSLKISNSEQQFQSLKFGKLSENDDRKTFISSTERQLDSISNKSKRHINKPSFRVKRVNKKFEYSSKNNGLMSNTPEKTSTKTSENKIIITKRKVSAAWGNQNSNQLPLYNSKYAVNNILTPLMV